MSEASSPKDYVKIWALLLVLLIISICGPMLEIRIITILTAFGIAIVKAVIVAENFMHLKIEKRYVTYMLLTMLIFVAVFFYGTAPDVMAPEGTNWTKTTLQEAAKRSAPPKLKH